MATPYADAIVQVEREISVRAAELVHADVREIMEESEEFDTLASARSELRRRIGGWENLPSYAACLLARDGQRRHLAARKKIYGR